MACIIQIRNIFINSPIPRHIIKRYGHTLRGKPPGIARTLAERLDENVQKKVKINIGFPQLKLSRSQQLKERLAHLRKQKLNPDLEKLARHGEFKVNLAEVRSDWLSTNGPFHLKKIAEHYGIYEHLFDDGFFLPRIPLHINFRKLDGTLCPVYNGNLLKPSEAQSAPEVEFDSTFSMDYQPVKSDTYWTLIMTNPDGHLEKENSEYIHWFVGNIVNNDISIGNTIVPYLQPIPPRGTGYHRHIFILYKQEKKIDFNEYKITEGSDLSSRTFNTLDFYVKHQDLITPAGLAFFQSDWEKDLTKFYHDVLNIEEPIYEYDFPKPYIKDQKWFPLKEPFNLYMDKYRDPKQISKEYLEKKLAKTHPFDGPEPALKFPNAHPIKNVPSWVKTEMKKDRLGWGRINDF